MCPHNLNSTPYAKYLPVVLYNKDNQCTHVLTHIHTYMEVHATFLQPWLAT